MSVISVNLLSAVVALVAIFPVRRDLAMIVFAHSMVVAEIAGIRRLKQMPASEYALYHGDTFIDIGTIPQLARRQGVSPHTIRFYKAPSYLKRIEQRNALDTAMILVKIEED